MKPNKTSDHIFNAIDSVMDFAGVVWFLATVLLMAMGFPFFFALIIPYIAVAIINSNEEAKMKRENEERLKNYK